MYLYIVISNKSASEHNIRPNKKVYTELCYYMENSILVAMATTLDDERMSWHTVSTVCTYVPNMKRENFGKMVWVIANVWEVDKTWEGRDFCEWGVRVRVKIMTISPRNPKTYFLAICQTKGVRDSFYFNFSQ